VTTQSSFLSGVSKKPSSDATLETITFRTYLLRDLMRASAGRQYPHLTCNLQAIILESMKDVAEEGKPKAAVGLSTECFGRDAGRPLVAVDHPRHDASGVL
jgi:hypothetical protein